MKALMLAVLLAAVPDSGAVVPDSGTRVCRMETAPQKRSYPYRLIVSINQMLNTLFGGDPDETLSSRAGRARKRGSKAGKAACALLDFVERCHCEGSIEFDDEGNPLPHQLQPRKEG